MSNKVRQFNMIKSLPIDGLRETVGDKFECKCVVPDCQKDDDSRRKAGFFWSSKDNTYVYHCFKCGAALSLSYFLKTYFKDTYIHYFLNRKNRPLLRTLKNDFEKENVLSKLGKIGDTRIKTFIEELISNKELIPYSECKDSEMQSYLVKRQIPVDKYDNFFLAKNFYNIHQQIKTLIDVKGKEFKLNDKSDKRLVWLFRNRTNEIIALQGRRFDRMEPRYMISKFGDRDNDRIIGNVENIDINSTVYVTEGYIDSLFLPNCVSLQGLHMPSITYLIDELKVKKLVVVFDNESGNKQIKKNLETLAEMSLQNNNLEVCLLPKDMRKRGKDINDYIINGMDTNSILHTINNNSYSGTTLKVRSVFWS